MMIKDVSFTLRDGRQEIAQSGLNYGVGLFPTFGREGDEDAFMVSADMKAINKESEHPEEALLLAEYMSSPEFGIPIYQTGLWMPNQKSLYEEENISQWFNEEIYPEEWCSPCQNAPSDTGHERRHPCGRLLLLPHLAQSSLTEQPPAYPV